MLDHSATDWGVVAVFAVVYLGMFLGGLPRLRLDRSGVALLGAIAVIALAGLPVEDAARAIDLPTIVLLFAFMVVSAQMRLGGFYGAVTRRVGEMPLSRSGLLAALILVAGALSAVFSNDIVCLAMTPVVARLCLRRGIDPLPFLIGLACAANIGSAATLIGNPQNMLIGSVLQLPFAGYVRQALPPVLLGLVLLWGWLAFGPGAKAGSPHPCPLPEEERVTHFRQTAPGQWDAWP
jgi:Na+/H+ antiporter NhaD/arsenite permease-like protein